MTTTPNFEIEVDYFLLCKKLPLHSNLGCFPNKKNSNTKILSKPNEKTKEKTNNKKEAKQLDLHDFRFRYY